MINRIKILIKKTRLYRYYKQIENRSQLKTVLEVASQEVDFCMNVIPDSKDSLCGRIRLMIHGMEKMMVKGDVPNIEVVFRPQP